jgi:protein HIRA/HIR1
MIILKPSWISHNGMPIFSIDIHPDGTRLATGGQGRDSGLVMLWNTAAVLDENSENDENVPKMLCQVSGYVLRTRGGGFKIIVSQ